MPQIQNSTLCHLEVNSMSNKGLARTAAIMMILIFISRVLGFVRLRAAGEIFGRTAETDAFNAAFVLPDLMYFLLVSGALSSAFIPVFTSYLATDREKEGWVVASTFLTITTLLLVIITILGTIFSPVLAPLVAYQFVGEQRALLIHLMRIMFPAVFFTALSGLTAGLLNSYRHFIAPVVGPIWYNIAITLGAYLLGPYIGITGMAIGTIFGSVGSFLIQLVVLLKYRHRFHYEFRLNHPGIKRILQLMGPALIGLSVTQLNQIINQNLASALPEGSITALQLANRVMQFPLGIFAMAISQVYFPTMSMQVAQGLIDDFRETFSKGLRMILFITMPAAAGLIILRVPVVRLLFETGEFGPSDTQATAYALLFYSLGLVAHSGIQIITRIYYSLQDTKTPVKVGLLSVVVNTTVCLLLLRLTDMKHGALALGYSVSGTINFFLYLILLRRRLGRINGTRIAQTVIKSGIACVIMGIAVMAVGNMISPLIDVASMRGRAIEVAILAGTGVAVYGICGLILRMEELQELLSIIVRRRR